MVKYIYLISGSVLNTKIFIQNSHYTCVKHSLQKKQKEIITYTAIKFTATSISRDSYLELYL